MTNKRILTLITLLLFLFLLAGCEWPWTINKPPEITSYPVTTATVGVDYTYNVVATDPDGDALTYSLTTEPDGMLIGIDSGKITWEADDITAAGVGDYDVVVEVKDEDGLSDTQDFTITVSEFVVELIGIEVEPEVMTLSLYTSETFTITAHYNNDTTGDVTSACVYGISDIDIVTIEADKVTPLGKVGTATITISYTDGEDITKGTTLNVIVEGKIKIRWLEDADRFYPNDEELFPGWQGDYVPSPDYGVTPAEFPATLIRTNGGYYFANIAEIWNMPPEDVEGSIVISEAGLLSGDATYTSPTSGLPIRDYFEGNVNINTDEVITGIVLATGEEIKGDHGGIIDGTYTQWSYAYAESDDEDAMAELIDHYAKDKDAEKLVPALGQGPDWWYIWYTKYTAHGE